MAKKIKPAKKAVAKKTAPQKAVVKKATAKKSTVKKPAPKKAVSKKTTTKKTAPKKAVVKKTGVRKAVSKKTATRKAVVKKSPAKKIAAKKPAPAKIVIKKTAAIKVVPAKVVAKKKAAPAKINRPTAIPEAASIPPASELSEELVEKTANINDNNRPQMMVPADGLNTALVKTENPVTLFDKNVFNKATAKGDRHSNMHLSSVRKGSVKPSGKKPLWRK